MKKNAFKKSIKFIDSWLDLRYRRGEWPGYVVAISHKGEIVFNRAYGYANLEQKENLTPEHIFRVASHSKTFTATAIMQLVEQGKIRLGDHIVKYLPWLNRHKDKRFKNITIYQLLSHGAGIIRDGLDADYWELRKEFPDEEKFKKEVLKANLVFDTNTRMKYSNIGYTLLGLIIEKISGKSYREFIEENIINPLKLKNTTTELPEKKKAKIATGYGIYNDHKKRQPLPNINSNIMSSATGICSNVKDLCVYFNAQIIGSGKLLTDGSKKQMQKPIWKVKNSYSKEEYGLGFIITPVGKRKVFGHVGSFPGHSTVTMCDPNNDLIVTVLTNCIDGGSTYIAKGLFSIIDYFQKNYSESNRDDLSRFEIRLKSLWSFTDVVSMGNKLIAIYPDTWRPFEATEVLKYLGDETLKIIKTDGFYSEGELVRYKFKKGKVEKVVYAGATLLPER